jgi:hypothetical protein
MSSRTTVIYSHHLELVEHQIKFREMKKEKKRWTVELEKYVIQSPSLHSVVIFGCWLSAKERNMNAKGYSQFRLGIVNGASPSLMAEYPFSY